ncbi:MAG: hypothetical protein M1827_004682 [Pycnora praestabilis]|nr:MAG: hypothetical protein M1827_004682 [Pycnora praestabilis]
MSSLTLKFSSLVVRTLSKPIANQIKAQAREHERFRRICVRFAQSLHRVDMRLRLGLLRDTEVEKKTSKDSKAEAHKSSAAQADKSKSEKSPSNKDGQEEGNEGGRDKTPEKSKSKPSVRIRPLSEAKAIDSGANFISETFLFMVGGALIIFESWRSRRKETSRRTDVSRELENQKDRGNDLEERLAATEEREAALENKEAALEERLAAMARELKAMTNRKVGGEPDSSMTSKTHEEWEELQHPERRPQNSSTKQSESRIS